MERGSVSRAQAAVEAAVWPSTGRGIVRLADFPATLSNYCKTFLNFSYQYIASHFTKAASNFFVRLTLLFYKPIILAIVFTILFAITNPQ